MIRWSAIKTGVLCVLVSASLVLTDLLWTGEWGSSVGVPFAADTPTPQAAAPTVAQMTRPYRIVVEQPRTDQVTVDIPGTDDYQTWVSEIAGLHAFSFRPTSSVPESQMVRFVRLDLGVPVSSVQLAAWAGAFLGTLNTPSISSVYLYQTAPRGPVWLALATGSTWYAAETDLGPGAFAERIGQQLALEPWSFLGGSAESYLPVGGVSVFRVHLQLSNPAVVPLVHSFFVNPEALTSVQEDANTWLWTDGSRAVWWDKQSNLLEYADPNEQDTAGHTLQLNELQTYIQGHGGAPPTSYLFANADGAGEVQFTLQPYVYGLPLLDSDLSVHIDAAGGHIAHYQQPTIGWSVTSAEMERTVSQQKLESLLHQMMPTTPLSAVSVELGYVFEAEGGNRAVLVPVFAVTQSGMTLWDVDAVTGQVLKGVKQP
ncbi:MAG: hypothetical protein K6T78_04260 [Alicyclobacillus sp.]|nr:hypothetical protein [Alicyclobacillus sp.]